MLLKTKCDDHSVLSVLSRTEGTQNTRGQERLQYKESIRGTSIHAYMIETTSDPESH